jgi:hypothetical protein
VPQVPRVLRVPQVPLVLPVPQVPDRKMCAIKPLRLLQKFTDRPSCICRTLRNPHQPEMELRLHFL